MSDLFKQPSISKYDKSDPASIIINQSALVHSQVEKENNLINYQNKAIDPQKLLYATIIQILFEKEGGSSSMNISHLDRGEQDLYLLISKLLAHFKWLSKKDASREVSFINTLSETWNYLLLSLNRRKLQKHSHEYLHHLSRVIDSIQFYAVEEGEPFGFYLSHHCGKDADWFPLPYLQMLSGLYEEHAVDSNNSHLSSWCTDFSILLVEIAAQKSSD